MPGNSDHFQSNPSDDSDDSTKISRPDSIPGGESETGFYDASPPTPNSISDSVQRKTVISNRVSGPQLQQSNATLAGEELVGSNLEHFTLEEFVGKGGMGAVFRATDSKLGRTVAVKVLGQHRTDPDSLRRFTNEAQSAARLDHPNIARVYYVGEERGWHFIVFEYINGVNLRDLIEHKGPLPLEEAWSYVLQITDALVHASARDVVHRDIKPSNILVTADGNAKLVDMGLARLHHVDNADSDVTASGVTLGTFDYISPEQARDPRSTDVRSDIYSLGCTLYYMLTGLAPYPTGTVLQKLLSHSSDPPPNPQVYRNDLDDGSIKVLHKMLSKRPEDRYQRPIDIINDVVNLADQLGLKINRGGHQWAPPGHTPQFTWLQQISWALPLLCLVTIVFTVSRLTKPSAELVLALPTFNATPYTTPAQTQPELETNNGQSTPRVPSPLTSPTVRPKENSEFDPAPDLQTVIVGKPNTTLPDNMVAVDSFDRALSLLPEDPEIGIIEIWEDLTIQMGALELDASKTPNQSLIVRGKSGITPSITILLSEAALKTSTPEFIQLSEGAFTFQNLKLHFQLPGLARQSWSLFSVSQVTGINFTDIAISLIPESVEANLPTQSVAVFNLLSPRNTTTSNIEPTEKPVAIEFSNTIVRGSLTLFNNPWLAPFHFSWDNGIFASDNWLFTQQTDVQPHQPDILLSLDSVTAFCSPGAINLTNESGTSSGTIRLEFYDSILTTEFGTPLFLIQQPSLDLDIPMTIQGANLAIANTSVLLERQSSNDLNQTSQTTVRQILSQQRANAYPDWFQVRRVTDNPEWVNSQTPPPDKSLFLMDIQDFAVDNYSDSSLGFDRNRIQESTKLP